MSPFRCGCRARRNIRPPRSGTGCRACSTWSSSAVWRGASATQLSGGQQQRLAFARGLVHEPAILLLDEPLSNLDAKLREQMRLELKRLQRTLEITTVYVTHDQSEALALSDEIAVFDSGRIVQRGTPQEIYRQPKSRFVADFVGSANFLPGTVRGDRRRHDRGRDRARHHALPFRRDRSRVGDEGAGHGAARGHHAVHRARRPTD